jgi:hypothetical protein
MVISTATVLSPHPEKTVFLIVGIGLALIVAAMVIVDQRAAPIRAAAAQALAGEVAAESRAFCEKHGMRADTQAHAACVGDVQTIRDSQTERLNRDHLVGF